MDRKKIVALLQETLGKAYEVKSVQNRKNNGITLNGVAIKKIGDRVAPVIYYRDEWGSEEYACARILDIYKDNKEACKFEIPELDAEKILSCVHRKLVRKFENEDYIADKVHKKFLDMEIIYWMDFGNGEVADVSKGILNAYNLDEQMLDKVAEDNDRCDAVVARMDDVLKSVGKAELDGLNKENIPEMIVLTNSNGLFGAATMMLPEYMRLVSGIYENGDFYVIPSSVHEVITVKDDKKIDPQFLSAIVREVNQINVPKVEQLGHSVYRWNHEEDRIEIAAV